MLSTLKVPGVYVQEVNTLPPSVAAVSTAIPAFLGYTERSGPGEEDLTASPVRITSLLDYATHFGGPPQIKYSAVELDAAGQAKKVTATYAYFLYESVRQFYTNGGGPCYIVSVGTYKEGTEKVAKADFLPDPAGSAPRPLEELAKVDEVTLVLAPDAYQLRGELGSLHQNMLQHCGTLKDRFAILDLPLTDAGRVDLDTFRNGTGQQYLSYGAAYAPFLSVVPPAAIGYLTHGDLTITGGRGGTLKQHVDKLLDDQRIATPFAPYTTLVSAQSDYLSDTTDPANKTALLTALTDLATKMGVDLSAEGENDGARALLGYQQEVNTDNGDEAALDLALARVQTFLPDYERALRQSLPAYGELARALESHSIAMPPSGAVTGAIARNDRNRGVWKAPANLSLNGTLGPLERFTNDQLAEMNVHPGTGKNVNAIRAFVGKGTLIFGARTLAGNDGEYKYVPVRRLMIFLEESIQKACERYVFEANDANTWTRLRGMIQNFLNLQWRAGALQGATPEAAYRVEVGLGVTMTADDVSSGRMIIAVSVAPVRPAEFIVLRFTQHQLL